MLGAVSEFETLTAVANMKHGRDEARKEEFSTAPSAVRYNCGQKAEAAFYQTAHARGPAAVPEEVER
eukprot:7599593-Pyramimonas_sp.AAC.1